MKNDKIDLSQNPDVKVLTNLDLKQVIGFDNASKSEQDAFTRAFVDLVWTSFYKLNEQNITDEQKSLLDNINVDEMTEQEVEDTLKKTFPDLENQLSIIILGVKRKLIIEVLDREILFAEAIAVKNGKTVNTKNLEDLLELAENNKWADFLEKLQTIKL